MEQDKWCEESEKEESSSYSPYEKLSKKIKKTVEVTYGETSKPHKDDETNTERKISYKRSNGKASKNIK